MLIYVAALALAVVLAMAVHEGGHYCMARLFGKKIQFQFSIGKLFGIIPIPRWVWWMPEGLTKRQEMFVAGAGFAAETLFIIPLAAINLHFAIAYMFVAAVHMIAYKHYAGEYSDFNWF